MMMARLSLLHNLPRLASMAPFLCLIVAQWECPDMVASRKNASRFSHGPPPRQPDSTALVLGRPPAFAIRAHAGHAVILSSDCARRKERLATRPAGGRLLAPCHPVVHPQ